MMTDAKPRRMTTTQTDSFRDATLIDPPISSDTPSFVARIPDAVGTIDAREARILAGRYCLGKSLGTGGYGTVFDAYDERLQKRVAIKILAPALASDPESLVRFEREAIAASRVRHDGIVSVTDFELDPGGTSFIVMEKLDGMDLADVLKEAGRIEPLRALSIVAQIADALASAHNAGVLHRDLKPGNIFLAATSRDNETVKIIDFGISKIVDKSGRHRAITTASKVPGTAFYMSPERMTESESDGRTDVYSLGVLLFELLTGQVPFTGPSAVDVLIMASGENRPVPSDYHEPLRKYPSVDRMVRRAMAVKVSKRFKTMAEFGEAIERCLESIREAEAPAPQVSHEISRTLIVDAPHFDPRRSYARPRTMTTHGRSRSTWLPLTCFALVVTALAFAGYSIAASETANVRPSAAPPSSRPAAYTPTPTPVSRPATSSPARPETPPKPVLKSASVEAQPSPPRVTPETRQESVRTRRSVRSRRTLPTRRHGKSVGIKDW